MLLTRDEGEESLQKLNRFADRWDDIISFTKSLETIVLMKMG